MAKAQNYIGGRGHRTEKCIPGGGTPHILSEQGGNREDIAHQAISVHFVTVVLAG